MSGKGAVGWRSGDGRLKCRVSRVRCGLAEWAGTGAGGNMKSRTGRNYGGADGTAWPSGVREREWL